MGWKHFAGGLILILFGIVTLLEDGYTRYGVQVPVGKIVAIGIIVYGLIMLRSGFKIITSMSTKSEVKAYFKCVNCGERYNSNVMTTVHCPKCSGKIENIEGFFERHPEFRDEYKPKGK